MATQRSATAKSSKKSCKPPASKLPANWREQLMDQEAGGSVRTEWKETMAALERVPATAKTQYPVYLTVRSLELLREISSREKISIQDLLREGVDEIIMRRVRDITPKKKAG